LGREEWKMGNGRKETGGMEEGRKKDGGRETGYGRRVMGDG
jgi:hypothetical protein